MTAQQPYNINVDRERNIFPTDVSPFIFGDSKDIIKSLLEDANARTEADRKISIELKQQIQGGGLICCFYLMAALTLVGMPFFICHLNRKNKEIVQATARIVESWDQAAKVYNEKLANHGVFVRLVSQSIMVPYGTHGQTFNKPQYAYEFSFSYHHNTVPPNYPVPEASAQNNFR